MGSSRTDCCFTATVTQLRGGRQLRQGQQSGSSGLPAKNSSSSGTPSASSDEETPLVTRPALLPASWLPALAKTTLAATAAVPPPLLRSSSVVEIMRRRVQSRGKGGLEKRTLACWADVGKLNYIIIDMLREAAAHTYNDDTDDTKGKQITKPK